MFGAIVGDIVGSRFEFHNHKSVEFDFFHKDCKFTDDSIHTIALADSILTDRPYNQLLKEYSKKYQDRGYGGSFKKWVESDSMEPYDSWGNGSAMRTSPVGWAYNDVKTVLEKAKEFASATHNHIEGVKGAQAVSIAIFLARTGKTKEYIKAYITEVFGYNLELPVDLIRETYTFHVGCKNTVPQAITCFLESSNYEEAIRLAISIGGDSDTLAAITGSIAEAYYKAIGLQHVYRAMQILDYDLLKTAMEFHTKYIENVITNPFKLPLSPNVDR